MSEIVPVAGGELNEAALLQQRVRRLREFTSARIGLRTTGGGGGRVLATEEVLALRVDHALARDAVWVGMDAETMEQRLGDLGAGVVLLSSAAADRAEYLRRPDLGRRLDAASAARVPPAGGEVVFCVADGLSARAVGENAEPVLRRLIPETLRGGLSVGPVCLIRQGRVAVGDEIAERMGAVMCVLLIGERPGLSAADSMGAYLTWSPRVGRTDAERVCVSNIRSGGLLPAVAAERVLHLMREARTHGRTGVAFAGLPAALAGS